MLVTIGPAGALCFYEFFQMFVSHDASMCVLETIRNRHITRHRRLQIEGSVGFTESTSMNVDELVLFGSRAGLNGSSTSNVMVTKQFDWNGGTLRSPAGSSFHVNGAFKGITLYARVCLPENVDHVLFGFLIHMC